MLEDIISSLILVPNMIPSIKLYMKILWDLQPNASEIFLPQEISKF